MAVPQYRDEVLVTLTSRDAPSSFSFPDRRFFLTKDKPVMDIGRTSKRNSSFEAAKNNAWFDSPVMSRDHASLKLDVDKQKVYIKDVGSLHGTFKNNQQLARNILCPLSSGDTIQFGVPIERGSDRYPACTMEARIKFGSINPEDRPKVFRVPDDSDVEESASDGDCSIRISSEILRGANMRPAVLPSPHRSTIDLTGNDQYPTSNIRGGNNYSNNALPPVSPNDRHSHEVTYVDLSSPSPEDIAECNGFSPISPEPNWISGQDEAAEEESDINLSESTDMDTASSPEMDSASQASSPASVASDIDDEDDASEMPDIDRDEFEDRDEYYSGEYVAVPYDEPVSQENSNTPEQFVPGHSITHLPQEVNTEMPQPMYETNTLEVLSTECMRQDIPENGAVVSPLITYTFKPQLPPIEQTRMEVPWPQPSFPQLLRLPSISETVLQYQPPQSPDSKAVAEVMGAKTGKYEFFAARAENKVNALPSGVVPSDNSISISATQSLQPDAPPAQPAPQDSSTEATRPDIPMSNVAEETQAQASPSKRLAPSEWIASGEEFLNTPLKEPQELGQSEAPVLDETSAYQFELSKKAACSSQNDQIPADLQVESTKRTHMEISDIVEASNEAGEQSTPSRPLKRKASEIYEPAPEEEEPKKDDASLTSERKRRSYRAQQLFRRRLADKRKKQVAQAPVADMVTPPSSDAPSQPPCKRIRRVAEVLSYAALGGVAVMSALIATAPTL